MIRFVFVDHKLVLLSGGTVAPAPSSAEETPPMQQQQRAPEPKTLEQAAAGDVFRHATTGAEIVVVERHRTAGPDELLTVQLNDVEGHTPGWIALMWTDARGWSFVREAL